MYKVRFCNIHPSADVPKSSFRPILFECDDVETAIKFALSVHEISNVPHCISVHQESDDPKIFRNILSLDLLSPSKSPVSSELSPEPVPDRP